MNRLPDSRQRRIVGLAVLMAAVVLAGYPLLALADFSSSDWQFVKSISLPPNLGETTLAEVTVDAQVFAQANKGLGDLRIVRDREEEVPYQLAITRGGSRRTSHNVRIQDLGHLPGRHTELVIDLGQPGLLHNEVEIFTTSKNFRRKVELESSSDGESWLTVSQGVELYDFTVAKRKFNARNTRVQYTESTARYLRVRILNGGEAPLAITGASVASLVEEEPLRTEYVTQIIDLEEDPSRGISRLTVDLNTTGLPTDRLILVTGETNFHRRVTVEGSLDGEKWQAVSGSGEVYAYETPKFTGSNLTAKYPEVTYRYLRLSIHNQDDAALTVDEVAASGLRRRLIFQATPGATYGLYYGNTEARQPSYDLERFLPYLETDNLPSAELGEQRNNAQFALPELPVSERFPWLITLAVAAVAAVAGLLLFGVLRQAKKVLPPPE